MKYKHLGLLLLFSLLLGCSSHKTLTYSYITTDSAPVPIGDVNAQSELAQAAVAVGHSMEQISAIDMAIHPNVKIQQPLNPDTIGMAQQTSLDWTGPIEPLLRRIANTSHYHLRILGQEPAIPVIVAINSDNVPLADILRNAAFQVEKKAHIVVYPSTKTLELRYYSS